MKAYFNKIVSAIDFTDLESLKLSSVLLVTKINLVLCIFAWFFSGFYIGTLERANVVLIPVFTLLLLQLFLVKKYDISTIVLIMLTSIYLVIYTSCAYGYIVPGITILILNMILVLFLFYVNNRVFVASIYLIGNLANIYLFVDSDIQWQEYLITSLSFFLFFFTLSTLILRYQDQIQQENVKSREQLQLIKSKNAEIELFNRVMTHDMKAPLQNIYSLGQMLQNHIIKNNNDPKQEKMIHHILNSTNIAQSLVNDLIDTYQNDSMNLEMNICNLQEILDHCKKKLIYQIELSNAEIKGDDLGMVMGDKRALTTLLFNLVGNSIKYQPKNVDHVPRIFVTHTTSNDKDIITVEDNGIGIEEKYLEKIFEPFKRLHGRSDYQGTGLGLSLCKTIVEKHHGTISATSDIGVGTKVLITLPANS